MSEQFAFQVALPDSYEAAIEKVTAALKAEGFGVLTRIDVRATLREKLDKDFRPYVILGACNPSLAYRALDDEPLVGLMMPCNVTVEERADGVLVSILNPLVMLGMKPLDGSIVVCNVSNEAHDKLKRVAHSLQEQASG
jgi:uncharacterized protein (DUF302 family)